MKNYPVLIRWVHPFGFRSGQWADITGVSMAKPNDLEPRLCFTVKYEDGVIDSIPISDTLNYELKAKGFTNYK